jgi:hypothetical protein
MMIAALMKVVISAVMSPRRRRKLAGAAHAGNMVEKRMCWWTAEMMRVAPSALFSNVPRRSSKQSCVNAEPQIWRCRKRRRRQWWIRRGEGTV